MTSRSGLAALSGLLFLLAAAPACSVASPAATEREPIGEATSAITGAAILALGEQWVAADLHYCQAAYGAVDGDSSCWAWEGSSHVCDRESNAAWNAYRSDCSGFVTWSWGLPAVGDGGYVTGDFAPFGTSISTVIQASDLQPGDAANLTAGGHIVLFKQWTTVGSEAIFLEEPGCSANPPYAHEFTSAVTLSGSSIHIDYEGDDFTAIRYTGATAAAPDWAASFVSQSWPLASTTMTMTVNQVLPATLTLKNVGAKTWDSSTKIGTTQPRDRTSPFAGADWLSPSRLAGLPSGTTVAPGQSYAFKFSFHAPAKPGTFDEFYGVVQDGVAWFSDPGQGGPPDDDLEVKIQVVAEASGSSSSSSGSGGAGNTGAGSSGAGGDQAGSGGSGATGTAGTGGAAPGDPFGSTGANSSCSYRAARSGDGGPAGAAWIAALGAAYLARRRSQRG